MTRRGNRCYSLTLLMIALLALQGCGEEDSGDDPTTSAGGTYRLTGTVPGTLIEGFCSDGSYYRTTSLNSGATAHPFALSLPNGVACQLVMTMNEGDPDHTSITPIVYITPQGRAIALKGTNTSALDLGYIPLPDAKKGEVTLTDRNANGVIDAYERLTREIEVDLGDLEVDVVLATDGAVTIEVDSDHDGLPDYYDDDDDNDGRKDWEDDDDDGDGIRDIEERDSDGDGVEDDRDRDDDNDGIDDDNDPDSRQDNSTFLISSPVSFTLPQSYVPDATGARLLSAQCAQCHGTNGYSVSNFDGLAGEADEVIEEMAEYHSKPNDDIMAAQAKAYTLDEARLMQRFFLNMASQYGVKDDDDDD